jgi:Holliday junction resolvase RusA-like endonuclease
MTAQALAMTVYGVPAPKGSRTLGRRRDGSTFTRPASNREHAWVEAVARQATWLRSQPRRPLLEPPYAVALEFYLARPAHPAHGHPTRGDVDKLARAVLDGLVRGGLISDDRHVVELAARKAWAATPAGACCRIQVRGASPPTRQEEAS